ncbi:MAG: hypothetical protein K6F14_06825 [Clostridiales bacterium]|nr:hypothetical protein [Clostridiales bacterium]
MKKTLTSLILVTIMLATLLIVSSCSCKHNWIEATCTVPKTCSECGKTEGEALGHTWIAATCTVPKTCSVCGETEGTALGHTWIAATCTVPKTCSVCGKTEGTALGHTWIAATCAAPKTCSICGKTEGAKLSTHSTNQGTCAICGTFVNKLSSELALLKLYVSNCNEYAASILQAINSYGTKAYSYISDKFSSFTGYYSDILDVLDSCPKTDFVELREILSTVTAEQMYYMKQASSATTTSKMLEIVKNTVRCYTSQETEIVSLLYNTYSKK